MNIHLQDITKDNYHDVCELSVSAAQQDFIASNLWSVVDSFFVEGAQARAIYHQEHPVGLFLWVTQGDEVAIWRFMIDQRHQGQGLGRAAFRVALEHLQSRPGIRRIKISYVPDNHAARQFYQRFGFIETGLDQYGEMEAVLDLG